MLSPFNDSSDQIIDAFDFQAMSVEQFNANFTNRFIWDSVINNEWQHYMQDPEPGQFHPFTLSNEVGLTITAKRRDTQNENFTQQRYLSGLISTHGKERGILPPASAGPRRISALLSLPIGTGVWPAWWFLPEFVRWPDGVSILPEIDAMESVGEGGRYYSTVHTYGVDKPQSDRHVLNQDTYTHNCPTVPLNEPHWYHFYRDEQFIRFGFDNQWTKTLVTPPDLQGPLHFNLNLAVGGDWPIGVTGEPTLDRYELGCWRIETYAAERHDMGGSGPKEANVDVIRRLERLRGEVNSCINEHIDVHVGELE